MEQVHLGLVEGQAKERRTATVLTDQIGSNLTCDVAVHAPLVDVPASHVLGQGETFSQRATSLVHFQTYHLARGHWREKGHAGCIGRLSLPAIVGDHDVRADSQGGGEMQRIEGAHVTARPAGARASI